MPHFTLPPYFDAESYHSLTSRPALQSLDLASIDYILGAAVSDAMELAEQLCVTLRT